MIGFAVLMLLVAALFVSEVTPREAPEDVDASIESIAPELLELASGSPSDPGRLVYLHSVIAGGAYDANELANAMLQDAIVEGHYRRLKPEAVRAEAVKKDRLVYVSYRKDDQIFWTRNKVLLRQGETILTDGTTEIRSRCGNCISDTPRFPVADVEPNPGEFDRLMDNPSGPAAVVAENAPGVSGPGSFAPPQGQPAGGIGGGPPSGSNGFASGGGVGAPSPSGASQAQSSGSSGGGSSNPRSDSPPGAASPPGGSFPPGGPPTGGGPQFPPSLIDPPPGLDDFDPNDPDNPGLPSDPDLPNGSDDGGPGTDPPGGDDTPGGEEPLEPGDGRSVPEPGVMLLIGGGAAIALLRRLQSRS